MKKAIFVDIDGTLRNSEKKVTKETINAVNLAQKNGYEIILCSGRSREHCIKVSKECGASGYIVNSNGAEAYNYLNNNIIFQDLFTNEDKIFLWNFAKEYDLEVAFNCGNIRYVTSNYRNGNLKDNDVVFEKIEEIYDKDVVQALLGKNDFGFMLNLNEKLEKFENLEIGNCSKALTLRKETPVKSYVYDIVKKGTSKGSGIEKFCSSLNIDLSECIAIGDNKNDLSMFEKVGMSVAMGNSTEYVKSKANFIAKTNDENGVANFLNMIINEW